MNVIELHGSCLFVSDAHFQTPEDDASRRREETFINMLGQHPDLNHLFLLGDIFDFWFEYRDVVPKGYFRLFNYLYEISKKGTEIHIFTGNHDMWMCDYFQESFNAVIYRKEQLFNINGKIILIAHGDGLGGSQRKYNLIKKIFNFKPNQAIYSTLHPRIAFSIARFFSKKSRNSHPDDERVFKGDGEHQIMYSKEMEKKTGADFFVFGHRHIPFEYGLDGGGVVFNTGDWLDHFSYITFDEDDSKPKLVFFNTEL